MKIIHILAFVTTDCYLSSFAKMKGLTTISNYTAKKTKLTTNNDDSSVSRDEISNDISQTNELSKPAQ